MDTVIRDALSGALSVSYSYHCFQMSRYQYMGEHMFSAMVYLLLRIPADAYQCFFSYYIIDSDCRHYIR